MSKNRCAFYCYDDSYRNFLMLYVKGRACLCSTYSPAAFGKRNSRCLSAAERKRCCVVKADGRKRFNASRLRWMSMTDVYAVVFTGCHRTVWWYESTGTMWMKKVTTKQEELYTLDLYARLLKRQEEARIQMEKKPLKTGKESKENTQRSEAWLLKRLKMQAAKLAGNMCVWSGKCWNYGECTISLADYRKPCCSSYLGSNFYSMDYRIQKTSTWVYAKVPGRFIPYQTQRGIENLKLRRH